MGSNKKDIAKELAAKSKALRHKRALKRKREIQQALDDEEAQRKAALDNGTVPKNTIPKEMDNSLSQKENNSKNDKPITATIQNDLNKTNDFIRNGQMNKLEKLCKDFANDPKNKGVCNILKDARGTFKGMEFKGMGKIDTALAFVKKFEDAFMNKDSGKLALQTSSKNDAKQLSDKTQNKGNVIVNEIKKVAASALGLGGANNQPLATKSKLAEELLMGTKTRKKPRPDNQ